MRAMTIFDDTYTDAEFQKQMSQANSDWMAKVARSEPDLEVDGLHGSLLSRVLSIFTGKRN